MGDVAIFGAGGLGRMVVDILRHDGRHRPCTFLDSDPAKHGRTIDGLPVIGGIEQGAALHRRGIAGVVVAVGENLARVGIAEALQARGLRLISAIHPLISVSRSAALGEHLIIGPRVTICVHARVGAHSVLSAGAIAEHDNVLGKGVFLQPAVRLAGGVTVDDYARLEIGSCVIPGRRIGRGALVEAGSVVIADVPANARVGGVPAVVHAARRSRFTPYLPEPVLPAASAPA